MRDGVCARARVQSLLLARARARAQCCLTSKSFANLPLPSPPPPTRAGVEGSMFLRRSGLSTDQLREVRARVATAGEDLHVRHLFCVPAPFCCRPLPLLSTHSRLYRSGALRLVACPLPSWARSSGCWRVSSALLRRPRALSRLCLLWRRRALQRQCPSRTLRTGRRRTWVCRALRRSILPRSRCA